MKRRISIAAGTESSEQFSDNIKDLSDNFDYVVDGFEKLARSGKEAENEALQLVLELSASIEDITRKIAEAIK